MALALLSDCSFQIVDDKETVVDVEMRKVVIHVKSSANSTVGNYKNEYLWTLTMSEDGKMIENIVEFTDLAYAIEFFQEAGSNGCLRAGKYAFGWVE